MTGPLVRKYMGTSNGIDGEYRARLFHAIRDLTADAYGGWKAVTNVQAGGGLYAQRIVTRRYYDLKSAKRKALKVAGLERGKRRLIHRPVCVRCDRRCNGSITFARTHSAYKEIIWLLDTP